jgi:hypothetical protein
MGRLSILNNACYYIEAVINSRNSLLDYNYIGILLYYYCQGPLYPKLKRLIFQGLKERVLED